MLWLLSIPLAGVIAGSPATAFSGAADVAKPSVAVSAELLLAQEDRRVRSLSPRVMKLLGDGVRRSRTFADLVTRVHRTDVIVYIEPTFNLPIETSGRLLIAGKAGQQRYLRIQVRSTLQGDHMIAVIAHELRHALEVAGDPAVVDERALAALYKRIGDAAHGVVGYDTKAARDIGRIVRDELLG